MSRFLSARYQPATAFPGLDPAHTDMRAARCADSTTGDLRGSHFSPKDSADTFVFATTANTENDGRPDTDEGGPTSPTDFDPDPAPPPIEPGPPAEEPPAQSGRGPDAAPGDPSGPPPEPPTAPEDLPSGRDPGATPGPLPGGTPVDSYTSGGDAATSYNVAVEFIGSWTVDLQAAFIEAADYISTIVLADLPDGNVDGTPIDDIAITATLAAIDGVSGTLGSAGPRELRGDGSFLPLTGAMTFDIADAANQFDLGQWQSIVLHEMLHTLGFGPLWSFLGLTSGSIAGGDIRFTGAMATDSYNAEFPGIAGADSGSLGGVPVETDGGSGTAGGHWDEELFDAELMTGYTDPASFVSEMTIASLEDMGYDTVLDNPYNPTDLFAPMPPDPLLDMLA